MLSQRWEHLLTPLCAARALGRNLPHHERTRIRDVKCAREGLVENLPRVLPDGLQAVLQRDSWRRPAIFDWLQQAGAVADDEMHRVFNCGIGLCVIVAAAEATAVVESLRARGVGVSTIGRIETCESGALRTVVR